MMPGRFVHGIVNLVMLLSQRAWDPSGLQVGDHDIAASGVPAAFVVRETERLHLTLRFWEDEWEDVLAMVRHGGRAGTLTWYPNAADAGTSFSIYIDDPVPSPQGTEVRPRRDPDFPRVLELDIVIRRTNGADFGLVFFEDEA